MLRPVPSLMPRFCQLCSSTAAGRRHSGEVSSELRSSRRQSESETANRGLNSGFALNRAIMMLTECRLGGPVEGDDRPFAQMQSHCQAERNIARHVEVHL